MSHPHHDVHIWSVEGRFRHLIYSPKGGIEGVLIDTDGIATQFVFDAHDAEAGQAFASLKAGQRLVIEGTEAGPSPKGEAVHTVYGFERLASVDGREPAPSPASADVSGTVVRFNYARHGEANGVVLDSGDFVHTKPDGLAKLGLRVGDKVEAAGRAHPLTTGRGRVVEATRVNGRAMKARKPG